MLRTLMSAKIHRATVTQADVDYVGSITIDETLMTAAGLLPGEQVHVLDIDNGARLVTYAIPGPPDSGVIGMNGAAARLIAPGDLVIVIAYAQVEHAQAAQFRPRVVHVDVANRIIGLGDTPGPGTPDA